MGLIFPLRSVELDATDKYATVIPGVVTFALAVFAGAGSLVGRKFVDDWGLDDW